MGLISASKRIADITVREELGEDFSDIVKSLKRRKEVSEVELAKKFDGDVNFTRSLLYRMHAKSFVGFARKKDERLGWYVYYWFLKYDTIYGHFFKLHHEKIGNLQRVLDRERETIYFECPEKCMRLDFHMGTEYSFKCPECGTLMEPCENRKQVAEIKSTIAGLKAALKKTI
jgi:transcription initiation factor TFIIE subunit alpha